MPNEPQISDYEPVTRRKASGELDRGDEHGWFDFRFKREGSDSKVKSSAAVESHSREVAKTGTNGRAGIVPAPRMAVDWALKRGHTVTFVGLFVFTFLLYFRPYEWSQSLLWLSSGAFWIASFTIAIFVPTQLGLENKITLPDREVYLVLLLLLIVLLSVPFALDRQLAWNSFVEYLKVVLMFVVMVNVLRTEKRLKILLFLAIGTGCVLSVSAVSDYASGRLLLRGQRIEGAIGGLFQNPNDLALHLVTIIPITVALMLQARSLLMKGFYGACGLLGVAGVVATFSRSGFLGMVCAGAFLGWRLSHRNKFLIPMLLSVLLIFFIVLVPSGYTDRLSETSDGSALARTDDLKRSLFIAARHPLLGVGIENYTLYSNSSHATHNAYTQVAAEAGLAAAAIYIMFLITPLRQLRRISLETRLERRKSRFYYISVGLEASLIGYMVCSFFASVAFLWYVYYLVAYAICIRHLYEAEMRKEALTTSLKDMPASPKPVL